MWPARYEKLSDVPQFLTTGPHADIRAVKLLAAEHKNPAVRETAEYKQLMAEVNDTEQFNWFGGRPYTYDEATTDMKEIWQQLHRDVSAANYPTLFDSSTPRGRELDRMSIVDWIERYVPGGRRSDRSSTL